MAADQVAVVTTPEPTSMADAHAAFRRLRRSAGGPTLRSIVSQANSAMEAADGWRGCRRRAASSSAGRHPLCYVRADARVPLAVGRAGHS